jgi:hypothetical protein
LAGALGAIKLILISGLLIKRQCSIAAVSVTKSVTIISLNLVLLCCPVQEQLGWVFNKPASVSSGVNFVVLRKSYFNVEHTTASIWPRELSLRLVCRATKSDKQNNKVLQTRKRPVC